MKILIPTAKEMNTDLPSIEAAPLKPESQAVLDALALYSASQLESFYKVSAEKAAEEFQNIQLWKCKLLNTTHPWNFLMDLCTATLSETNWPR